MLISIKYTLWQFLSWKPVQWRDDRISQAKNSWNGQLLSTRQDFLLVEPFGGKIKIVCSTASEFIRHSAIFFKKMGHSRPLFHLFSSFPQTVNNNCSTKVADDWIRTRVLWFRKRPLCQLHHNHCPLVSYNVFGLEIVYPRCELIWKSISMSDVCIFGFISSIIWRILIGCYKLLTNQSVCKRM